jgi:hypothetical protein
VPWPPAVAVELVTFWCNLADPFLCTNPLWLRLLCAVSPLVYTPFWLWGAREIARGGAFVGWAPRQARFRAAAIAVCAALLVTVPPIVAESAFGAVPSPRPGLLLATYAGYIAFPAILLYKAVVGDHDGRKTAVE